MIHNLNTALATTTTTTTTTTTYQHYLYSVFCQRIQIAAAYYYGIRKIVTVISLHLVVQLAKCTPYQHLDCNIFHDWYLSDALRSTKQLRLRHSILRKDTNTLALAGLELVILSLTLFHQTTHALKILVLLFWNTIFFNAIFFLNFNVFFFLSSLDNLYKTHTLCFQKKCWLMLNVG